MSIEKETFFELVKKENRKILRELKKAEISPHKMKVLEPVVANAAWMRVKLDEAREAVALEEIVVPYDNGGGQKGMRKNPFFDAYVQLFKAYMLGMDRILENLPDKNEAETQLNIAVVRPESVLDKLRARK